MSLCSINRRARRILVYVVILYARTTQMGWAVNGFHGRDSVCTLVQTQASGVIL